MNTLAIKIVVVLIAAASVIAALVWQDAQISKLKRKLADSEHRYMVSSGQLEACRAELDMQSEKVRQAAIDKEKAAAEMKDALHKADQNYFERRKAVESMQQLEAVEFMLDDFLGGHQ